MRKFEECWLCLRPAVTPVCTSTGYLFCRECILNNLADQKKQQKKQVALWNAQQQLIKHVGKKQSKAKQSKGKESKAKQSKAKRSKGRSQTPKLKQHKQGKGAKWKKEGSKGGKEIERNKIKK
eukprot:GHVT01033912.1.p1 GENE.GHVT01033912.1~~GHVT01033912.1.p1  ORF type:complete len:123 (-),score=35.91 GHVT01033912.1:278-646(-)